MRFVAMAVTSVLFTISIVCGQTFPAHRGNSPWSFTVVADPSDTFVVNDADSSTIDLFLFRSQGPIVIDVPIRRYVAPTDANGFLANVDDLVRRGIVGATAAIHFPAFDVDQNTFPVFDGDGDGIDDQFLNEVDEVYLNDQRLGTLQGDNQIWISQSFTVPISRIKFPSAPGQVAINRFRVDVDVANRDVVMSTGAVGAEIWATAIDWIGIKFEATSPVVLVHGIRSNGAVFANFVAGLTAERVTSDNSINLTDVAAPDPLPTTCTNVPYNNSIANNVRQLTQLVPAIAQRFGTDSLHVVTHSKGGLDMRGLMSSSVSSPLQVTVGTMSGQPVRHPLTFPSLVTLNTPHGGSVLAQYGVEARQLTALQAARAGLNVVAASALEGSYYCDLTPGRAASFIASTRLPNGVQTASVATDADTNGDGMINNAEGTGFTGGNRIADRLYQLVGGVSSVRITVTPLSFRPDRITVTETPTSIFQDNDVIVTTASAGLYRLFPITGWHHLNVHATANATTIARDAQRPGIVDWRLR